MGLDARSHRANPQSKERPGLVSPVRNRRAVGTWGRQLECPGQGREGPSGECPGQGEGFSSTACMNHRFFVPFRDSCPQAGATRYSAAVTQEGRCLF